jgi:hypothetical protein
MLVAMQGFHRIASLIRGAIMHNDRDEVWGGVMIGTIHNEVQRWEAMWFSDTVASREYQFVLLRLCE